MAQQRYERVILEPPHAAFGYPGLSLLAALVAACFTWFDLFMVGVGVGAIIHMISMVLRHRSPHGEQLFLRSLGNRGAFNEWKGARRVYHG